MFSASEPEDLPTLPKSADWLLRGLLRGILRGMLRGILRGILRMPLNLVVLAIFENLPVGRSSPYFRVL